MKTGYHSNTSEGVAMVVIVLRAWMIRHAPCVWSLLQLLVMMNCNEGIPVHLSSQVVGDGDDVCWDGFAG
jgi:hypothetical protein